MRVIIYAIFVFVLMLNAARLHADEQASAAQIRQQYEAAADHWTTVPGIVLQAFVGAEDRQFFETLPQYSLMTASVARMYRTAPKGGFERSALTVMIGLELSHDEILDWFAHEVYLGLGCYGVVDSAEAYFGKSVDALGLSEAAFLAGLAKAPSSYHPARSFERAIARRNFVLSEMQMARFISEEEVAEAAQAVVVLRDPLGECESALQ